jgi:hypothetical protein
MGTAEGRAAVTAWRRSRLAVGEFARQCGLDEQRLRRWSKRVRASEHETVPLLPVDVVPVPVTRPTTAAFELRIGAVVVCVPADFDEAALRRLLGTVGAC